MGMALVRRVEQTKALPQITRRWAFPPYLLRHMRLKRMFVRALYHHRKLLRRLLRMSGDVPRLQGGKRLLSPDSFPDRRQIERVIVCYLA